MTVKIHFMEESLVEVAKLLGPMLLKSATKFVRNQTIGDEQARALDSVFSEATAIVLVEIARHDREDKNLPERLGEEFRKFYQDPRVGESLVKLAISAENPPIAVLKQRFREVGNDPDKLPMDFDQAMQALILEIADQLRKEAARVGSSLANLVLVGDLGIIRNQLENLLRTGKSDATTLDANIDQESQFLAFEHGLENVLFDVVFVGFYLPDNSTGNLTNGGMSRAFDAQFSTTFDNILEQHRLNRSELEFSELPIRMIDHRPPDGYHCSFERFANITKQFAEKSLGVVWGTIGADDKLRTIEVVLNPDRFLGGYLAFDWFLDVKKIADREDLPSSPRVRFAASLLAAMWAQCFCAELDRCQMYSISYTVAADSRRIIERSLEQLARELSSNDSKLIESQRQIFLPGIIRQEASSLWQQGEKVEALERLKNALSIWPYGPLTSSGEFREFCESYYAFSIAHRAENFREFLEENYETEDRTFRDYINKVLAQRALIGFPPSDLELFIIWIEEATEEDLDVEEDVERWFTELVAEHPNESHVCAYWGEARRIIAVKKYGAGMGSPTSWRMDKAVEKFEEAYSMAPDIPYFAARVQALKFTAALGSNEEERRERFDDAANWMKKARSYYREHAPWFMSPG